MGVYQQSAFAKVKKKSVSTYKFSEMSHGVISNHSQKIVVYVLFCFVSKDSRSICFLESIFYFAGSKIHPEIIVVESLSFLS